MMLKILVLIAAANVAVCLTPVREFWIRRDLLVGVKAPEFSVYDKSGKNIQYRIESKYFQLHSIELIAQPSKQVVARLKSKPTWFLYEGSFSVLDPKTQEWTNGNFSQNLRVLSHRSVIQYEGRRFLMEHSAGSLTTKFLDDQNAGQVVGQYKVSLPSMVWATKYTMEIYDKELPDAIFLFGLAVRDYIITERKRTTKGKGNLVDPLDIITSFR